MASVRVLFTDRLFGREESSSIAHRCGRPVLTVRLSDDGRPPGYAGGLLKSTRFSERRGEDLHDTRVIRTPGEGRNHANRLDAIARSRISTRREKPRQALAQDRAELVRPSQYFDGFDLMTGFVERIGQGEGNARRIRVELASAATSVQRGIEPFETSKGQTTKALDLHQVGTKSCRAIKPLKGRFESSERHERLSCRRYGFDHARGSRLGGIEMGERASGIAAIGEVDADMKVGSRVA